MREKKLTLKFGVIAQPRRNKAPAKTEVPGQKGTGISVKSYDEGTTQAKLPRCHGHASEVQMGFIQINLDRAFINQTW